MDAALVAARTIHFGATMLVFGELLFGVLVAGRRCPYAADAAGARIALDRHAFAFAGSALAAAVVSGLAWVLLEAMQMAGVTMTQALADGTVPVVLSETQFGRVFTLRALIFVGLAASLAWMHGLHRGSRSRAPSLFALVLAGALLATLAGAGHVAAASGGAIRALHIGADAAHLLAAGAWVGALPPLVHCVALTPASDALNRLARRFSVLGIACVGTLIASGVVNTLFLVGSFAALFGTAYGRLLDVKILLFAVMIAIAAINRSRLTPRLAGDDAARRALARNAKLEIAAAIVIVAIVGALGTMVPGAHESPRWPFGFALDLAPDELSPARRASLAVGVAVSVAAIAIIIVGMRRRTTRWSISGALVLAGSLAGSASIFAVPAFPTTYATSPVPYDVDAVARGAARFAHECSRCHGADARGNGPTAATLAVKPKNLAEHALHHPQGTLFGWIAHGIPGSPMPAFSPQLADHEIWELVQFIVARASADAASSFGPRADARSTSRAPDFAYEVRGEGRRTLVGERKAALLVLYSTDASDARLAQLASDTRLARTGVRVIPIPLRAASDGRVVVGRDVADVYRMFAEANGTASGEHVELLVDGKGILRARWTGVPSGGSDRDAEIATALQRLRSPAGAPAGEHHHH